MQSATSAKAHQQFNHCIAVTAATQATLDISSSCVKAYAAATMRWNLGTLGTPTPYVLQVVKDTCVAEPQLR